MDGCAGFSRPSATMAPKLKDVKYYGSADEIAKTGSRPAPVRSSPASITILPRAIGHFKFHHGGTDREAEIQIRKMLADFLEESARTVTTAHYLVLSRDGYRIDIGPNRKTVTAYRSAHRERTWEQVKAGIPSRIDATQPEAMPLLPTAQDREIRPKSPRDAAPTAPIQARHPVMESVGVPEVSSEDPVSHDSPVNAASDARTGKPSYRESAEPVTAAAMSHEDVAQLEGLAAPLDHPPSAVSPSRGAPQPAETPFSDPAPESAAGTKQKRRPARREVPLSATAAIALAALLIGRRTGRRR